MVSFELGKEIAKDVFRHVTSVEQRKASFDIQNMLFCNLHRDTWELHSFVANQYWLIFLISVEKLVKQCRGRVRSSPPTHLTFPLSVCFR